jgi:hypothetical protein
MEYTISEPTLLEKIQARRDVSNEVDNYDQKECLLAYFAMRLNEGVDALSQMDNSALMQLFNSCVELDTETLTDACSKALVNASIETPATINPRHSLYEPLMITF